MKKNIKAIVAVAMTLIVMSSLTACNDLEEPVISNNTHLTTSNIVDNTQKSIKTESTIDTDKKNASINVEMPQPFVVGVDAGGDENDGFYLPFNSIINGIPVELMTLRNKTEVDNWINSFPSISYAPSNISEYENIYSFITDFSITKDEAETALVYYLSNNLISYEQLNIIYSGDKELITKTFATEYSIVIGENIYCPNWIYTHNADDYAVAGISSDVVAEKASTYSNFNLTEDACVALADKLSAFTGETISIYPVQTYSEFSYNEFSNEDVEDEWLEDNGEDIVEEIEVFVEEIE